MFCYQCGSAILESHLFCGLCWTRKRGLQLTDLDSERDIIEYYFRRGFCYESILMFLQVNHNVKMSLRTLKRRLHDYDLKKSGDDINEPQIRQILEDEIQGPFSQLGYRGMWNKLTT